MKYLIAAVTTIVCTLLAYITLDRTKAEKLKLLRPREQREEAAAEGKELSRSRCMALTAAVAVLSCAASIWLALHARQTLELVKMSVALACLTGAACNDYREHRIPNLFPLLMAAAGLICLAVGYFAEPERASAYVFSSLIAAVGVALCLTLASILTRHGIGYGDIKLLCALALIGGVYAVCGSLFFGIVICALVSIVLLATKKKTLKGSLPFGPFLLAGFCITVFASIY